MKDMCAPWEIRIPSILRKRRLRNWYRGISGEYSGVGAVLSQSYETKAVTITNVFRDSPAEKAGVKSGDILYQVDEHEITDEDLNQVVAWIKGEEGTEVTLHVIRDSEELELIAVRGIVEAQTVEYEMKDSQVGYIRVTEFDKVTLEQFREALDELDSQGMQGLVIDLRSNPGGDLDTVLDMLRLILPKGIIVSTENKEGRPRSIPVMVKGIYPSTGGSGEWIQRQCV